MATSLLTWNCLATDTSTNAACHHHSHVASAGARHRGGAVCPCGGGRESREQITRTMDEAHVTQMDAVEMQITASHRRTRDSS
jgi:hypothetical protein